jgi:glyoxylase-like metal-dependent hydrolase (beta-lactamase superfamily II)
MRTSAALSAAASRALQRCRAFGPAQALAQALALALSLAVAVALSPAPVGSQARSGDRAPAPSASSASIRLYVLDGGVLESDPTRYQLTRQDVGVTDLAVTAFLIVHPKGTLMWDTGAIADDSWVPTGKPIRRRLVLSDSTERYVTVTRTLGEQLKAIGYPPEKIQYLALSHYHWDHTANANMFVSSTWLVRTEERTAMLPDKPPVVGYPSTFADLKRSRTTLIKAEDHDVFGDGLVVIKRAGGHTPGHQVLYLKLPKTGGVILSGDLYHYPAERTLNRVPTFEVDAAQTRRSREAIDAFQQKTGAALWIQHDFRAMAGVRKAPQFYD